MSLLKRFGIGRRDAPQPNPPSEEQDMVFEEVPDKEKVADFTYKEDPAQAMVERILALEKDLEESGGNESQRAVKEVLLAKARYEQAAANERLGRSKRGEADRLLAKWQQKQDRLDSLRESQIVNARDIVLARYKDDGIDADTAAQLRRHQ